MTSKEMRQVALRAKLRKTTYALYAALALAVAGVAVILYLSTVHTKDQEAMLRARNLLAERIQFDLQNVMQREDALTMHGEDARNEALSAMRKACYAADAVNDVLVESFGERYSLFDPDLYSSLDWAMSECEKMIKLGLKMDAPLGELSQYIGQVRDVLDRRISTDGTLLPKDAEATAKPK